MQHPVRDAFLARIGDITVSFALLENQIQTLAGSQLHESQPIRQIITAELSFRNLRALTLSLYRERHGEDSDFEELRALMRRAEDLEQLRNQITHSIWGAGRGETITRIKMTAKEKRGLRFDFESVTAADLGSVAEQLVRLGADVQQFWIRLLEAGKAYQSSKPDRDPADAQGTT